MGEEALQAEDRLVEMEQSDLRVVTVIEEGYARFGDMICGLRTKLGKAQRRHDFVMRFRLLLHGGPHRLRETLLGLLPFKCQAFRVKASLKAGG